MHLRPSNNSDTMNLAFFVFIGLGLFVMGLATVLKVKNILWALMGIELMLNGVALNFMSFSRLRYNEVEGEIATLFVISLAVVESAIFLAVILLLYRNKGSVRWEDHRLLKEDQHE